MIVPRDPSRPLSQLDHVRLARAYPDVGFLEWIFRLAPDFATAQALWRGEHVAAALLDQDELREARKSTKLIKLVKPAELLEERAA